MQYENEAAENSFATAQRIIEISLPIAFNNRTSVISDTQFGKSPHECVLERGKPRDPRYDGVSKSLGNLVRSSHGLSQEIRGLNNIFYYRKTFSAIAVEQLLIAVTMQKRVDLPDQIPNVMQASIHPLPAKKTMNVSRIAGDENTAFSQPCYQAVMDTKILLVQARLGPTRQ